MAYAPLRAANDCAGLPEQHPNITFLYNGLWLTAPLPCDYAVAMVTEGRTYCPLLPERCPSDLAEQSRKYNQVYRCAADAPAQMLPYRSTVVTLNGGNLTVRMDANVTDPAVATCLSADYMCASPGEAECRGAPAFLEYVYPGLLAPCSLAAHPDATATDFLAASSYNFDAANRRASRCLGNAITFCKRDRLLNVCPGIVERLRPKELPYSFEPTVTPASKAALGELVHSVSDLAGCTGCYADLIGLAPTVASGFVANWSLAHDASVEELAMSLPSVSCVTAGVVTASSCEATRADLDRALYDAWDHANLSERTYEFVDPDGVEQVPLGEGKYQGAYHINQWSAASAAFDFTVLYNGTVFPRYGDPNHVRKTRVGSPPSDSQLTLSPLCRLIRRCASRR